MNNEFEISKGTNYAQMVFDGWAMALNPTKYKYKVVIPMDEFTDGLLDAYNAERYEPLTMRQITGSNGSTERFVQFYLEEWLPSGNNLRTTWIESHKVFTMA